MKKIVIAIDGYSSCGKSTMAKELAHRLGYVYVDTGAMYRSVTLFALREHLFDAEDTLDADRLSALLPQVRIDFRLNPETLIDLSSPGQSRSSVPGLEGGCRLSFLARKRRLSCRYDHGSRNSRSLLSLLLIYIRSLSKSK